MWSSPPIASVHIHTVFQLRGVRRFRAEVLGKLNLGQLRRPALVPVRHLREGRLSPTQGASAALERHLGDEAAELVGHSVWTSQ
jgi:hypothetical protein